MATINRTASGIKYDTAVRGASQKSTPMPTPTKSTGSGDAKIAAFKAGGGSSSTSMPTPSEYNAKAEADKKAQQSVQTQVQSSETTTRQVTPEEISALRDRYASTKLSAAEQAVSSEPSIFAIRNSQTVTNPITRTQQKTFTSQLRESSQRIVEPAYQKMFSAQEEGTEKAKDTQMSDFSRRVYERTQQYTTTARQISPIIQASKIGTPEYGISKLSTNFIASNVEMAGMIPGGVETIAKKPSVIVPALVVGAVSAPYGIAQQAREDPAQLVFDTIAFAGVSQGLGAVGGGVVKSARAKIPAVSLRSSPQEALVKLELPVSQRPASPGRIVPEAEFVTSAFGKDIFNLKNQIAPELITVKQPGTAVSTVNKPVAFAGQEIRPGVQEVYLRVSKQQAKDIAGQYVAETRNIKTDYGSFLEIKPTGQLNIPKEITPQITTRKGLFEMPEMPVRLEKKVKITPTALDKVEVPQRLMLEQFETVGAEGRAALGKDRQIAEFATLETKPTYEQKAYANIIERGIRPGQEQMLMDAYEPVFGKMGTSIRGAGVDFKLIGADDVQLPPRALGYTTFPHGSVGSPIVRVRGDMPPEVVRGTFAHEMGHVLAKGGFDIGVMGDIRAEAVAEATRIKAAKIYDKMYGTKTPRGIAIDSINIIGEPEVALGYPLGGVVSPRMQRWPNVMRAGEVLNRKNAVTSRKRKPPQQLVSIPKQETVKLSPELQNLITPKYQSMLFGKTQIQTAMLERQTMRARLKAQEKTLAFNQQQTSFQSTGQKQKTTSSQEFMQGLKQKQLRQYVVRTQLRQYGTQMPVLISGQVPAMGQIPRQKQMPMTAQKFAPVQSFKFDSIMRVDTSLDTGFKTVTDTITRTETKNVPDTIPDTFTSNIRTFRGIPELPQIKPRDSRKRKGKKTKISKSAQFTDLYNPLRKAQDVFGFGRML